MKDFLESLMSEVEGELELLELQAREPLQYAEAAIKILIPALGRLKTFFGKHKLQDKEEEIEFFKRIKPALASKLIYYNEIYNIETSKPFGSDKLLRKYYNGELSKLTVFYDDNLEFCRYYRKGSTFLDDKYFIRGKHDVRLTMDSFYYQADQKFSTSHDYKVARIMASDQLREYLTEAIAKCSKPNPAHLNPLSSKSQRWTGSKVALVELVYALHTEGVFNNGTSKLSDVASFLETSFNIDLGHFTRVFLEIRARKTERTKFLNTLRDKLVLRMDETDNL
jgi:hypothetical protein